MEEMEETRVMTEAETTTEVADLTGMEDGVRKERRK